MRKKRQKPFSDIDEVPDDPRKVLEYDPETPGEISRRTGLNHYRVCDALVKWHREKRIIGGKIVSGDVSIPAFRLKGPWDER